VEGSFREEMETKVDVAPLTAQMKGQTTVGKLSRLLLSRQQVNHSSSSRASVNFNTAQARLLGKSCEALKKKSCPAWLISNQL